MWDSGEGYNHVEYDNVMLGNYVSTDRKNHVIKIRRTGKRNPSAIDSEVRIRKIVIDGKALDLTDFMSQKDIKVLHKQHLFIKKDGAEISFDVKEAKIIEIVSSKTPRKGFMEINIDGDSREYDLYGSKKKVISIIRTTKKFVPGNFTAAISLPRYDIKRFKFQTLEAFRKFKLFSVAIASKNGDITLPIKRGNYVSEIHFENVKRNTKRYFHPIRFGLQIIFAALCAYVTIFILNFIITRGGLKSIILRSKRYVFWLMFLGSISSFSTWLLAYWPGYMTSDSIHIWWAAKKPGYFIHTHPFMNVIYYRFLQQIWDNVAIVPIFQILTTSILSSYIFYYIYKKGVNIFFILPFYFAFVLSVPIGLYTISLWKDIPFAILVLFWAFYLMNMYLRKKENSLTISYQEILFLTLSLICLCLFRYNGITFIIIIPITLAISKILSIKKVLIFFAVLLFIGIINVGIMKLYDKTEFFFSRSNFFIKRLIDEPISTTVSRIIKQYPNVLDINSYKHSGVWYTVWYRDNRFVKLHENFTRESGYNEFVRYQKVYPISVKLFKFLNSLTRGSYKEPWVYFTWNPYYLLLSVIPVFFLWRYFPLTAVFGSIIFSQVFILLLILGPYNYSWRYYYFLLFSLYFLIPIGALDLKTTNFGISKTVEKSFFNP